jgi:hypothetical protein
MLVLSVSGTKLVPVDEADARESAGELGFEQLPDLVAAEEVVPEEGDALALQ